MRRNRRNSISSKNRWLYYLIIILFLFFYFQSEEKGAYLVARIIDGDTIEPDFDSCNLKTLIYQGIKSLFFVYSTTASLRINLGIFIPKALNI